MTQKAEYIRHFLVEGNRIRGKKKSCNLAIKKRAVNAESSTDCSLFMALLYDRKDDNQYPFYKSGLIFINSKIGYSL